uniref:NADP-dependent oxidoreductase domain-containing protein n=1 Tax=Aureoumbra lagunensis TaxID=44058 RepID=A0A7S3JZW5_9STRA|mmetsp:Transcript_9137/g.11472  ORF Transcript_9137/g.11472 Transcript_9137/m.11472 type:complete len:669 (+) Transcript_9137:37-2043(+)
MSNLASKGIQILRESSPVVLEAIGNVNFIELEEFMKKKHNDVIKAASENGACVFCGFDIRSPEEWCAVLSATGLQPTPYVGGAAVRKLCVGSNEGSMQTLQVVTANESPPSEPIPPHHELAQTPEPPSHICFYCQENDPVPGGGGTPICRSDEMLDFLVLKYPGFVQRLETAGVKYVKITPAVDDPTSALGRSWKSMYHVQTKEEAEKRMKEQGSTWEWINNNNDCRITSPRLPAIRTCSNGRKAFFNQILAAYTGWIDSRNDPKKAIIFADDHSPMPSDIMDELVAYFDKNKFVHPWKAGDFMIIDNTVSCHSRESFDTDNGRRRRKVMAAIANGIDNNPNKSITTNLVLSTGDLIPSVGLGCWKIDKAVGANTVYQAIKSGYRLIDSAADYGNEIQTGQGIRQALAEGICTRSELFIVTKLWNSFHSHVDEAIEKSLRDLDLDYVDLYLIHFPIHQKYVPISQRYPPEWVDPDAAFPRVELDHSITYEQTWRGMERQVERGLAKNIGVCNIGTTMLQEVLNYCKIKPTVLQVEMHPLNTQQRLLRFARTNGIQVMAFSNLASASYVELGMATQSDSLLQNATVTKIAQSNSVTPAQVLLRWAVQRGTIIIPKSSKSSRLIQNIDLFHFALSDSEMTELDNLNCNRRFNDPGHFCQVAFNTFCPIYE